MPLIRNRNILNQRNNAINWITASVARQITVSCLLAATLYFAAAVPELAPHSKVQNWQFYIWHGRGLSLPRATNRNKPTSCQMYNPRWHCRMSPTSEMINSAFESSAETFVEGARQTKNAAIKL